MNYLKQAEEMLLNFHRQTLPKRKEILEIITQLPIDQQTIMVLWYIEKQPKEKIRKEITASSPTTVYAKHEESLKNFALLHFGADALNYF